MEGGGLAMLGGAPGGGAVMTILRDEHETLDDSRECV